MYNKLFITILLFAAQSISFAQQQNIALHKPVIASSERADYPAKNAVDGRITRNAKWMTSMGRAPHILEIGLQKYYNISEIAVHTGIPENERLPQETTQAAGFWSVKNFRLQYWDDANWTDFPKTDVLENRLTTVKFKFAPVVTTFKVRFVADDGEPINVMEIEVFGTETPNMPAPPSLTTDIKRGAENALTGQSAQIKVNNLVVGKSMKYVGYNQGYFFPGSNVSGWLEYSNVNSVRVWTALSAFVPPTAVQVDQSLASVSEFDKRKNELRASPENNRFINWPELYPLYDKPDSSSTNAMVFNYALSELKRLNIDVVLQINSTEFDNTWSNKWKQWQRYYALAYYAAKTGNVAIFAMQNEPNHAHSGPMKLDQWIGGMQIVSDAVHAAVEDVNKKYQKNLQAKFVGPVTAGQNTDWWAGVAKAVRTDYHGKTLDKDLIDIFSTHSYNSPAAGYTTRISNIRRILTDNHPAGQPIPIVFTEIGRWMNAYLIDKEETMDSPSLFTEWAGIYANNMKNGGYGMWAFKFANTNSGTYDRGIKSGHHLTWQGRRIVEDAYKNLAQGKPVKASSAPAQAKFVTDSGKQDHSTWLSDSTATEKWLEIDLGAPRNLGSAVVYTGSSYGVYTGPDRIKNFKLQYWANNTWQDIPGAAEKECKYVQVFMSFKQPISTGKVRFLTTDRGRVKVREIKLFAAGDGPTNEADYNIAGIQRTGEVVRLFAKGFKDERKLLETKVSVTDGGLDTYTAYDEKSGNYYMWLVQRGLFDYKLNIDLSALPIAEGAPITTETVNANYYGEITNLSILKGNKQLDLTLPAQSVLLLTIPAKGKLTKEIITAESDATVSGGSNATRNYGKEKQLVVSLDAGKPENNGVTFIHFDITKNKLAAAQCIIFSVNGRTDAGNNPFRFHVYALPANSLEQNKLNWKNAPYLDAKEALVKQVGQEVFIAGELTLNQQQQEHSLDVTDLIKKHPGKGITFILVREIRQLGDDADKGRKAIISSKESDAKPKLTFWSGSTKSL